MFLKYTKNWEEIKTFGELSDYCFSKNNAREIYFPGIPNLLTIKYQIRLPNLLSHLS
jgi:hypothetical protein